MKKQISLYDISTYPTPKKIRQPGRKMKDPKGSPYDLSNIKVTDR